MVITQTTFTAFDTTAAQHSVGELNYCEVVYTVNQAVGANWWRLYIAPAFWINAGSIIDAANVPQQAAFYLRLNNTLTANTFYAMTWTGTYNQRQYRAEVKYTVSGSVTTITARIYGVLAQDFASYQNGIIANHDRLLKNLIGSTSDLTNNATPSIYNGNKSFHLGFWIFEEATPVNPQGLWSYNSFDSAPQSLEWWNEDTTNVLAQSLTLTRNASAVTDLSIYDDTTATVAFKLPALATPVNVFLLIFQNDAQNDALFYMDNYQLTYVDSTGGTPASYELANYNVLSSGGIVGASPNYSCDFLLDSTSFDANQNYNIAFIIESTNGGSRYYSPYIYQNISAAGVPNLCPPDAEGSIYDYLGQYGEYLEVSPQERLQFCVNYDGTPFNACASAYTTDQFPAAIQSIQAQFYSIDGTIKNVYQQYLLTRNGAGDFVDNDQFLVSEDKTAGTLTVCALTRVRYEDTQCLYSIDTNTNVVTNSPANSMNWTNKTIICAITLQMQFTTTDGTVINYNVTRELKIEVHDYDPNELDVMTITFDQNQLCNNALALNVTINKTDAGDDYLIIGIDKSPFNVNNFEENEFFGGLLEQLNTPKVSAADDQFSANVATASLDLAYFQNWQQYRFVAIKKPLVYACDSAANSGGGEFTSVPVTLGAGTGNVYLLRNAYALTLAGTAGAGSLYDNFEFFWNSISQINTGFVYGHGLHYFDKNSINPQTGLVEITGASASTGWWFLPTCPDPIYNSCPDTVVADPSNVFNFGNQQIFNQFFAVDLGAAVGTVDVDYDVNANNQAAEGYYFTGWILDAGVPTLVFESKPAYGVVGTGGFIGGSLAASIARGAKIGTVSFIKTATMDDNLFIIVTRWSADAGTPDFEITVNCPV